MRFFLLALFAIACSSNGPSDSCVTNANCESNRCVSGLCMPVSDSGPLPLDAAADMEALDAGDDDDAGSTEDAGDDAGASIDAGASTDAGASMDAGDAGTDAL